MRVAILLSNRWNSAITEYALSAAASLRMTGYDVTFVPLQHSPGEKRAREMGLAVAPLPSFGVQELLKCRAVLKAARPDVILTCGGPEETLVSFLPQMPPQLRFRGQALPPANFKSRLRASFQSLRTSRIIFPSQRLEEQGREFFPGEKCARVVLGIDTSRFRIVENEEIRDELVIFGRLDPVKGHEQFLTIYSYAKGMLGKQGRTMPVLHIVGEEANVTEAQIMATALRLGLAPGRDVRITKGRHPNPSSLLSGALIGVVSSLGSEIICRVAEEFLVCGAPVFVSGAGSLDEVIFDRSGWSYRGMGEEGSARMLAGAIETSRGESTSARKERAALAQRIFSLETMGRHLDGQFQNAIRASRGGRRT